MKKKFLIIMFIILLIAGVFAFYFILINKSLSDQKEAKRTANSDIILDSFLTDYLYSSDNYTITLEIPEESTKNRWINLDSLATAPFWSWLDTRLYEGTSTLTIKVSKSTRTASFDDGTDLYFLALKNGDVYTYFPRGHGYYDFHSLKNPEAASYVDAILFSRDSELFKSRFPSEDASVSSEYVGLTRKIDSTPFLGVFMSGGDFKTRDAIRMSMEVTQSSEPTLTMTCEFSRLLADISGLLYNEASPKDESVIGDYHLKITVNQFNKTEPVILPDSTML